MNLDEIENLKKISSTEHIPYLTKTSLIIREEYLEKLKAIGWWERLTIKDILEEMLSRFFSSVETSQIVKEKIVSKPAKWSKTSVTLREEYLGKLKVLALVKRTTIRDLLNRILEDFLSNLKTRPIPKEKRKLIE